MQITQICPFIDIPFPSPGELQRLLEYPENRHYVQHLKSPYSQVTYPVQIQRHGKSQGISTRDANKITVSNLNWR